MMDEDAFDLSEEEFIDDQNIYAQKTREILVDEDCLRPEEDGFMQGYEEAGEEVEVS